MTRPLALVTGASLGIGAALARVLDRRGYDLVLAARSRDGLEAVARSLDGRGRAEIRPCDLSDPAAGAALEESLSGREVDVLVNNAGWGRIGPFLEEPLEAALGVLDVNARALTELSWRFGRAMRARGRGRILNVASTAAFQPGPGAAVYYATKAYVLSLTEALGEELRGSGVTATALCPGPVPTGFQSRAGVHAGMGLAALPSKTAEEVAEAGVRGLLAGRRVVIPGAVNALGARLAPVAPRGVLLSTVARLHQSRGGKR